MSTHHSTTERLIEYWRARAGEAGLPPRSTIQPADFAELLPRVFILGRTQSGIYPVRLAGGFLDDLHGGDLRRRNALTFWDARDRSALQQALEETRLRPEPLVATAELRSDAGILPMEVLYAPLAAPDGSPDRFLGLYQPLGLTARLRDRPVVGMSLKSLRRADGAVEFAPRLRLATLDGRRIA
jgi:hypothetical protein